MAFICFFLFFVKAQAKDIQFSGSELSQDTLLPIFDEKAMVKNPRVKLKDSFGLSASGSIILTEPVFREISGGVTASYHFSERSALSASYYYWNRKVSGDGENLQGEVPPNSDIDFETTPSIDHSYFVDFRQTAFYGKISLSKSRVINLLFHGGAGVGGLKIGDKTVLGGRVILGQKIYFAPKVALGLELAVMFYKGPNPMKPKESSLVLEADDRSFDDFETKMFIKPVLRTGISFLF